MDHVLDNPVFNGLSTGNKNLGNGNAQIKYFSKEVAPFVAVKNATADEFQELYDLLPHDGPSVFVWPAKITIPAPWQTLDIIPGYQMTYIADNIAVDHSSLVVLTDEHVSQMLELTKLTNPGPFAPRTIDFGHYRGIFDDDKLVAMAGQRMNPLPYAEVSAVCTHPDYVGKGYARQLMGFQINRIKAEGNIPFLHVRADNTRAIEIYHKMGFETRSEMNFYIIKK
ncbi:GNAT family N-acetyltransferase [Mucilaginibacter sp. dw_454]|uniref:GNAT family N-acetyltransferase n=1 Tax=Mucilaginibacter sp. dw_454 TaxID=2720079 RepID=UPI001BD38DE7|nr:GNAT family N-acetyltransferase [Mucilaginibacter sp. dw_454]